MDNKKARDAIQNGYKYDYTLLMDETNWNMFLIWCQNHTHIHTKQHNNIFWLR